ncbi:MAG: DinB family protein [Candidatus Krumholzibacteriota bacterium]|nr:DinB family protein [Candidatus Krumholzibacteriota bacterium]
MNLAYYTTRLGANADAIDSFVSHIGIAQARWKPAPEKWSMLEVVCHLYDEERFDFRQRIDYLLHKPGTEFPRFDPVVWVQEHRYAEQDIVEMRTLFRREREHSVSWLAALESPDWSASRDHSTFGTLSAGRFLASWVAHDYLHLRQMARLNYEHLAYTSGEPLDYAGVW